MFAQLANTLRDEGAIDERENFIEATFAAAKGGGDDVRLTKRGKGVNILAIVDRHGLPLSISTACGESSRSHLGSTQFRFLHA